MRSAMLVVGLAACYAPQIATGVPCSETLECPGTQICDQRVSPPVCVAELPSLSDAALEDGSVDADPTTRVDGSDAPVDSKIISAANVEFPPTETLTTSPGLVAVRNLGSSPLTVTGGIITGSAMMTFAGACSGAATCLFDPPIVVSPGTVAQVAVQCTPIAGSMVGLDANLSFQSDTDLAPESDATAELTCQPTRAGLTVAPSAIDFGEVREGMTATRMLTVSNPGTATLTYRLTRMGGAVFTVLAPDCSTSCLLGPGASSIHTVAFTPNDNGTVSAELRVMSLNPDPPPTRLILLDGAGD